MQHPANPDQLGQQIVQQIVTLTEPHDLLLMIAQTVGRVLKADVCLVCGIDPQQIEPFGFWCTQNSVKLQPETVSQLLNAPSIVDLASPIVLDQIDAHSPLKMLSVGAWMQIPTRIGETANGIVGVGYWQPHSWSSTEQERLQAAAQSVAVALSQIQLRQQAQLNSRYQTLIKEFNQVRYSAEVDSLLNLVLAAVASALQVDRGYVLKLKYKDPLRKRDRAEVPQGSAEVVSQWSTDTAVGLSSQFELAQSSLCQQAWQTAPHPLMTPVEGTISPPATDVFPPEPLSAFLAVPIMGSQSGDSASVVLGFFVLQQRQPRVWHPDEVELVKWAATQASVAIIYNQTLRRVQSLVDERTAQLQLSLDVQAKLSERMRQQIEKLRRLNQVKDEFIANLSDALKHPLTKIKMAIQMLKVAPDSQQRQRYLDILELECAKEINLVNDLLTLHQLEEAQFQTEPQRFDLTQMINEIFQALQPDWAERGLKLEINDRPSEAADSLTLLSDPKSIKRILLELLTNAAKFSAPDTTVRLNVAQQKQAAQQTVIAIANTGVGISDEEQAFIFDKFQQGKNVAEGTAQGTGLGLALVKSLVQHLNGSVQVSSVPLEDSSMSVTCFTLTLPQFLPPQLDS